MLDKEECKYGEKFLKMGKMDLGKRRESGTKRMLLTRQKREIKKQRSGCHQTVASRLWSEAPKL